MLLVLDTNTAISGLLWGGMPGKLIEAAEEHRIELVSSSALLAELEGVLRRKKFTQQLTRRAIAIDDVVHGYAALVTLVHPVAIAPTILDDPADDQVLAVALAAEVDGIVSGDHHLLTLQRYAGIPMLTAAVAVEMLGVR